MADIGSVLGGLGGGAIGAAIVQLRLDAAQYERDLAKARGDTDTAANTMGAGWTKFGALAKAGLAVGAVAAVKFATDAVKAAVEAEQAHTKLVNTFENNADRLSDSSVEAFEAQANAIRELTGVDDEAIISAQALLGQFELTGGEIEQLIPLVVDLSAKMGIGLDQAAKAVGKATQGSTGALQRYGIQLDKSALAADGFRGTLEGLNTVAGFAEERALDEPWRILESTWEETQEAVGQKLIPVLIDLAETVQDLMPILSALADVIGLVGDAVHALLNPFEEIPWDDIREQVSLLEEEYRTTALSTEELTLKLQALEDEYGVQVKGLEDLEKAVASSRDETDRYTESYGAYAGGAAEATEATTDLGEEMVGFAQLTRDEFREWHRAMDESLSDVSDLLGDLADDAHLTADEIIEAFTAQAEALADYEGNWRALLDRGLPDELTQQLADMGLEGAQIVEVLATASDKKFDRIVRSFQRGQDKAGDVARAFRDIGDAADSIPSDINIQVHTTYDPVGTPGQALAAGGIIAGQRGFIARGPTVLVGEGRYSTPMGQGAEAVLPLDDATMSRLGAIIAQHMRPQVIPVVFSDELNSRVLGVVQKASLSRASL